MILWGKKQSLYISKDKSNAAAELNLEKSSMGMQMNSEVVAKPTKPVRRHLNFGVEDYTKVVSSEDTVTSTIPNFEQI